MSEILQFTNFQHLVKTPFLEKTLDMADFVAADKSRPMSGRVAAPGMSTQISCSSRGFELARNHAADRMKPASPMHPYRIACKAAAYHCFL